MKLALFDLDGTLIRCDSEARWCRYLTENRIYDMSGIDRFVHAYRNGGFDVDEFMRFQLAPLAQLDRTELHRYRDEFLEREIRPSISDAVRDRVEEHRARGHVVVAISAAHDFIAAPICESFCFDAGLYTLGERKDGQHTGEVEGTPCFGPGKVARLDAWLASRGCEWRAVEESWFYSDSFNDLPLLERVDHAVAVRPDSRLRSVARAANWEIVDRD